MGNWTPQEVPTPPVCQSYIVTRESEGHMSLGFRGMFSVDRVQTGRQEELDAVRGLSVFLMVG